MDTLLVSECLDLTARRVALDQRYRDLVELNPTSSSVFSVFDDSGTFLGVVTDRQATLFPGRTFADLIVRRPPETVQEHASAIQLLKRMRKDACEPLAVFDAQGRYTGIVSMASLLAEFVRRSDINRREREALVSQLRAELENRKISANVLESTSDAVLIMDARLRIQYVNRAFTAAMGYPGTDIVGRPAGFFAVGPARTGLLRRYSRNPARRRSLGRGDLATAGGRLDRARLGDNQDGSRRAWRRV